MQWLSLQDFHSRWILSAVSLNGKNTNVDYCQWEFYKQYFRVHTDFTSESNGLCNHISSTKNVKCKTAFRLVFYDMLDAFKICSSNSSTYQGRSPSLWDQNSWVPPSQFTSLERAFCNQAVHHSFIALVKRWLWFRDRVRAIKPQRLTNLASTHFCRLVHTPDLQPS